MAVWLKVIGAIILMACYALPMTSCTEYRNEQGTSVEVSSADPLPDGVHAVTTHYFIDDEFQVTDIWSWFKVGVFSLPLLILIHRRLRPSSKLSTALWFLEPFVLAAVVFAVWDMNLIRSTDVGSYAALIGVVVYSCGWTAEAYHKRKFRHQPIGATTRDA